MNNRVLYLITTSICDPKSLLSFESLSSLVLSFLLPSLVLSFLLPALSFCSTKQNKLEQNLDNNSALKERLQTENYA